MDAQERVKRAYARISAIRSALSAEPEYRRKLPERHVTDYHEGLSHLEEAGYDVTEFRVPEDRLAREFEGRSDEQEFWSEERFVDRATLMTRIDSVLTYFDLAAGTKQIGFHGQRS